jgi:2-iminobutanoate/2-iminopropanoate deaminase
MKIKGIKAENAPQTIGPYSQAILAKSFIFLSMQLGIDPRNQKLITGGIEPQIEQIFLNVHEILKQSGTDLTHVVKTTLFLKNMAEINKVNQIYATFFQQPYPARSVIVVNELPLSAEIGLEVFAVL